MKFRKKLFKKEIRGFLVSVYRNTTRTIVGTEEFETILPSGVTRSRVIWLGPVQLLLQK